MGDGDRGMSFEHGADAQVRLDTDSDAWWLEVASKEVFVEAVKAFRGAKHGKGNAKRRQTTAMACSDSHISRRGLGRPIDQRIS